MVGIQKYVDLTKFNMAHAFTECENKIELIELFFHFIKFMLTIYQCRAEELKISEDNMDFRLKNGIKMEKLFEDENGYIYPSEDGYRVYWKKVKFIPDVDIKFSDFNEAHFYLRSVSH